MPIFPILIGVAAYFFFKSKKQPWFFTTPDPKPWTVDKIKEALGTDPNATFSVGISLEKPDGKWAAWGIIKPLRFNADSIDGVLYDVVDKTTKFQVVLPGVAIGERVTVPARYVQGIWSDS